MARTSKNTSKKNETKKVKQEVKNEIVDEKKVEEIVDNAEIKGDEKIDITEIIDKQVKETVAPRWAKDVYGYNWMGQCYDE